VEQSGRTFSRQVDRLPAPEVLAEIDRVVDMRHLHDTLMQEGLQKFADPQRALLKLIAEKRASISGR
jgi:transaldolase